MQVLTQIIIISWELGSYENPQIRPISSKIIPPSVTSEFQYGHQTSMVVYIEFARNFVGFNPNYYYFMRIMQLWKSPNYANKFQNYSFVGDS